MALKEPIRSLLIAAVAVPLAVGGDLAAYALTRPQPEMIEICELTDPPTYRWIERVDPSEREAREGTGSGGAVHFKSDESGQLVEVSRSP